MPSKRSTRSIVKRFALKRLAMKLTVTRRAAIGIIAVCIAGTAILIVARSSEPTSAASVTPAAVVTVSAPVPETPAPATKSQPVSAIVAKAPPVQAAGTVTGVQLATIEGCLVQENEEYRLKNTSGDDAPKGRSWKSGFLHRGSKTVDVVDANHRLNLAGHVGERVTISGALDGHRLQGSSMRQIAPSCR